MATLAESASWEAGIYQLEISDPVLGGPDGIDNLQAKQLANRTTWLNARLGELVSGAVPAGKAAKLETARTISFSGAATGQAAFDGSAAVAIALTLANSGVGAGSYAKVTVSAKGIVTGGGALVAGDIPQLDWSKINTGTPTTLAGYGITDALAASGTAVAATKLAAARTIGGVAFDGTANINLPGVNQAGNQNTTGTAAALATARTINGVPFDGTSNIVIETSPAGLIEFYAGATPPTGRIKANGASLSRTTYAALWAYAQASGNLAATEGAKTAGQYGPGNGASTFTIPDLRGEFLRVWDDGRGVDAGRAIGSSQAGSVESHTHGYTSPMIGSDVVGSGSGTAAYRPTANAGVTQAYGAIETRPRSVAVLACIAY